MDNSLLTLFKSLPRSLKIQLLLSLFVGLITACLEVINIGLVYPLILTTAGNQSANFSDIRAFHLLSQFIDTSNLQYICLLLITVSFLVFFTRLLSVYLTSISSANFTSYISTKIYKNILYSDYTSYLRFEKKRILNALSREVDNLTVLILRLQKGTVAILSLALIVVSLLILFPHATTSLIALLLFTYLVITQSSKSRLNKKGMKKQMKQKYNLNTYV